MLFQPTTYDGYKLLHDGCLALANAEENGMHIDIGYVEKQQAHMSRRIAHTEKKLERYDEIKKWRKIYRRKFNLDSPSQMSDILFNHMGYEPAELTDNDNPSVSQTALEQLDIPFVQDYILMRRLKKARDTYLANYMRETVKDYLHPFFHLHTVITFRSSSSKINFQNQPVRIPVIKKAVRRAIIPRPGRMLGEIDYSGVEVRIAACYHKDPNMIAEINDPERDMHRDMAMMCYQLGEDEWTRDIRYCGKNKFVFPQFYGDYYAHNARDLWNAIVVMDLKTEQGIPLKKHLKKVGLGTYNKFEKHIQEVEDYFWNEKFGVYGEWKEDHWEQYCRQGYVDLKSGFRCSGLMGRNDAINYPVQGAAFHCLLWSLIRLDRWLRENNMSTMIIGQIHDSIVLDIDPAELNDVMAQANRIMTQSIRSFWPWIIVPLEIEAELSPVDGSWYLKKEVKEPDFECDCGSCWMYENKHNGSTTWECPVCGRTYESGNH